MPVKETTRAKSRLAGFTPDQRAQLALAFALDAATAARQCAHVREIVAITNDDRARPAFGDLGVTVVADDPDDGLNPALAHGARQVRQGDRHTHIAAMSGDLPALTGESLEVAFEAAARPQWFVPDTNGSGTTLLAARAPRLPTPAFGPNSRAAHLGLGAEEVVGSGLAQLRRDVDTVADLRDAVHLGVGAHTSALLEAIGEGWLNEPSWRSSAPSAG